VAVKALASKWDGETHTGLVRRANAAGAIVASRLSCSTAMPRSSEIDALLGGGSVVDGAVVAR